MDISQILSLISKQNFEDNVSGTSTNNNMLPFLLSMVQDGGKMDNDQMLSLLAKTNPQMQTLLPLIKIMNLNKPSPPTKTKTKFEYIKIKDYYNI